MVWPSRLAKTLCIQTGRKLADQARDDVVKAVRDQFNSLKVVAIQMGYEVIRVTFSSEDDYRHAMERPGLHLFGIFCRILGGGPPITMVHVFDFPFEEDDSSLKTVFADFGDVKGVKKQTYLFDKNISTGTRLVSLVLKGSLPRSLTINGYLCRVWYKGQPLVCNLCGIQGHKSSACPNKDKCRRCGERGHFARACPSAIVDSLEDDVRAPAIEAEASNVGAALPSSSSYISLCNVGPAEGRNSGTSSVDPPRDDVLASPALVQDGSPPADPVEGGVEVSSTPVAPASGGSEVPPSGDVAADEAYLFTCGQAVPDSQVSLLSSPAPSPVVEDASRSSSQNVVSMEEGVAASQAPAPDRSCHEAESGDPPVPVGDGVSQVSVDFDASSGIRGGFLNKMRSLSRGRALTRRTPYSTGSRHANLPPVVSDRPPKPGPGQLPKR